MGPSYFDSVYNISMYAASDLTPGLRQYTHGPELSCVAGTLPPLTDPMYSLICVYHTQFSTYNL